MAFDPLRAAGMVLGALDAEEPRFLGSCFSLRDSTSVITAAHCIDDLDAERLYVRPANVIVLNEPGEPQTHAVQVREVVRHPDADVAILRLGIQEWVSSPSGTPSQPTCLVRICLPTAIQRTFGATIVNDRSSLQGLRPTRVLAYEPQAISVRGPRARLCMSRRTKRRTRVSPG